MNEPAFKPTIIALAGGSGSGKTSLAKRLAKALGPGTSILSTDSYYHDLSHLEMAERIATNFDQLDAIDHHSLRRDLTMLKRGHPVQVPKYDMKTHCRLPETAVIKPAPWVLLEGLFVLALHAIRPLIDLGLFVQTPLDICLQRRLQRDCASDATEPLDTNSTSRKRTREQTLSDWHTKVAPAYLQWIEPSKHHAQDVLDGTLPLDTLCQQALTTIKHKLP